MTQSDLKIELNMPHSVKLNLSSLWFMSYFYFNQLKRTTLIKVVKFVETHFSNGSIPKDFFNVIVWEFLWNAGVTHSEACIKTEYIYMINVYHYV